MAVQVSAGGPSPVELTTQPALARDEAGPWLAAHRYLANIPATVLADCGDDGGGISWAIAHDEAGAVVGVGMHAAGRPPYLPPVAPPVAASFAEAWWEAGRRPRGALGDEAATAAYARRWEELSGEPLAATGREILHVLDRLVPPEGVPGAGRTGDPDDVELVSAWFSAFAAEVYPGAPGPIPRAEVEARLAAGRLLLWTGTAGHPVAMAGYRPPTAGVGRVGPVFTPPAARGHGYAAAVTTAATRVVLALGGEAMLFADAGNPTSNGVYRRIGYRPRGEIVRWEHRGR